MDNNLDELVKQLQYTSVELPVHQQILRRRLLALHTSPSKTAHQRPFYANRRMSTMISVKTILPIGAVVILLGVLILGWLWLSPGSDESSDKRRLAERINPQDVSSVAMVQGGGYQSGVLRSNGQLFDSQTTSTSLTEQNYQVLQDSSLAVAQPHPAPSLNKSTESVQEPLEQIGRIPSQILTDAHENNAKPKPANPVDALGSEVVGEVIGKGVLPGQSNRPAVEHANNSNE